MEQSATLEIPRLAFPKFLEFLEVPLPTSMHGAISQEFLEDRWRRGKGRQ
jgi:hypothetical protein